jgi:hypothetical protein
MIGKVETIAPPGMAMATTTTMVYYLLPATATMRRERQSLSQNAN